MEGRDKNRLLINSGADGHFDKILCDRYFTAKGGGAEICGRPRRSSERYEDVLRASGSVAYRRRGGKVHQVYGSGLRLKGRGGGG